MVTTTSLREGCFLSSKGLTRRAAKKGKRRYSELGYPQVFRGWLFDFTLNFQLLERFWTICMSSSSSSSSPFLRFLVSSRKFRNDRKRDLIFVTEGKRSSITISSLSLFLSLCTNRVLGGMIIKRGEEREKITQLSKVRRYFNHSRKKISKKIPLPESFRYFSRTLFPLPSFSSAPSSFPVISPGNFYPRIYISLILTTTDFFLAEATHRVPSSRGTQSRRLRSRLGRLLFGAYNFQNKFSWRGVNKDDRFKIAGNESRGRKRLIKFKESVYQPGYYESLL